MKRYHRERDYYAVLGVPCTATAPEIKRAFRNIAKEFHPDTNNGNPEKAQRFMYAAAAYEVLRDPQKRSMYDRMSGRNSGNGLSGRSSETERVLSKHILMPWAKTYAQGVHALQEACANENNLQHPRYACANGEVKYRPLTFKENLIARLIEFNTLTNPDRSARSLEDRLALSSIWNDSCTGVIQKARSTKFKIVPIFKPLITIDREYKKSFLPVSYNDFNVPELDSSKGMYSQPIPRDKICDNEGWRFALEDDVGTLREYVAFVEAARKEKGLPSQEAFMGFYVWENILDQDISGALFVGDLDYNSSAIGNSSLDVDGGSFVRRSPVAKNLQRQIVG